MEDELVQNILSQSTPEAAFQRAQNRRGWMDTDNFKYKVATNDLLNGNREFSNQVNQFFTNLSGVQLPMGNFESSLNNARQTWRQNEAVKRAEERLAEEQENRPMPGILPTWNIAGSWYQTTEDTGKLDKYIAEELGYSPEEAQKVYWDTWNNANKQLGTAVGTTLGMAGAIAASGGAFGIAPKVIADAKFMYDGAKAFSSPEGWRKTVNLAKKGQYGKAALSGVGDLFDLALMRGGAKSVTNFGKLVHDWSTLRKIKTLPNQNFKLLSNVSTDFNNSIPQLWYKQGGVIKAQKGELIKPLIKIAKTASKTKSINRAAEMFKELPAEWEGLEIPEITSMHYGFQGKPKGISSVETNRFVSLPKVPKSINSNFDKFLSKSIDEQNDIVKFWNDENFNSFEQLQRDPKQLSRFKNWLKK